MDLDLALRLSLALAIGLMVGLERGWREREAAPGSRTAGLRTYALSGLLGGIFAALAKVMAAPSLVGLGFAGFILIFAWFKREEQRSDADFSVTGTVAAMLVFALGALAVVGSKEIAAASGIVATVLLAAREWLHGLLQRMTWIELRSSLLLLAMTGIVLPLLPDRTIDPLGAINPREIWMFTVLIAGLSYAGYLGMRLLGPSRGVLVAALAGAMVSSTAVTVAFARRAAGGEDARLLSAGASVAGAVSLLRVVAVASLIQPALLPSLAVFAVPAAIVFLLPALRLLGRSIGEREGELTLGNPFEITSAIGFALLLAVVGLAAAFVNQRFGAAGLYPLGAIAGLADVDAFSVSTARLAGGGIAYDEAALAILLCLAVNAIARCAYGLALARGGFGYRLGIYTSAALAAGIGAGAAGHWLLSV